jgi:hypothetical protein
MIISNASFAFSFFLLVIANNPAYFFIVALTMGFANAQLSGTMDTWLDNNYKRVIEEADPERKIYGFSVSRVISLDRLTSASAFVIGGVIATFISREHVFFVQACLFIMTSFVILKIMKDVEECKVSTVDQDKSESKGYFGSLKRGIQFLLTDKIAFFFIMGTAFIFLSFTIWGELILMPLYFGYTGSDLLASSYRTMIFLVGVPIAIYMSKISAKTVNSQVALFYFLHVLTFFTPIIILLILVPTTNRFNLTALIITAIILIFSIDTVGEIAEVLRRRTMVDLVPSNNRNAVYSLISTFVAFFGVPLLPLTGKLIKNYGIQAGVTVALIISILGSIFIYVSLYYRKTVETVDKEKRITATPTEFL